MTLLPEDFNGNMRHSRRRRVCGTCLCSHWAHDSNKSIECEEIWNRFIATAVSALVQPCLSTGPATYCYMEKKHRNIFSALVQSCLNGCTATHGYIEVRLYRFVIMERCILICVHDRGIISYGITNFERTTDRFVCYFLRALALRQCARQRVRDSKEL